jgi:signal transduction histidine kinase
MSLHDPARIEERLRAVGDPVRFLVNLFAHSPVGFAVWTADGAPLLTNKSFMDMFLVEPPPEYNVLRDELLAANGMLALFQRAFAGEMVQVPTFWYDPREHTALQITEGRRVAISMTIFPLFAPTGEIEFVAATYKDETEIMRAHDLIREREVERREKEAVQAANRELEAFSYSVAHDLRAPLRSISGFTNVFLEEHRELPESEQEPLRRVAASAERMGQMIDALLALARLSRTTMQLETIDLVALATSVMEHLRAEAPERAAELVLPPELAVRGDPRLLRTVLENLLANAWKFTRGRPIARVEVGAVEHGGERHYFVRDNGAGFDMAHVGRLFAPFQRLHLASDFEGTGIGLATVARIVQRHGGRVWAEGKIGHGATVYFTIGDISAGRR